MQRLKYRGSTPQTFQRRYRHPALRALALEVVKRLSKPPPDPSYKSSFEGWHESSYVRSGPKQAAEFEMGRDFYSRALVPILKHPDAEGLNEQQVQEILILSLYNYLEFTVQLETGPVNEICKKIREASFLDWLPIDLKRDALRIYTDEGAHAEMSNDLLSSVRAFMQVPPIAVRPQFLTVLDRLKRRHLDIESDFVTLLFVIVSETLITGSLGQLPKDKAVQQRVSDVAKDHARDEARHHSYFSEVVPLTV